MSTLWGSVGVSRSEHPCSTDCVRWCAGLWKHRDSGTSAACRRQMRHGGWCGRDMCPGMHISDASEICADEPMIICFAVDGLPLRTAAPVQAFRLAPAHIRATLHQRTTRKAHRACPVYWVETCSQRTGRVWTPQRTLRSYPFYVQ